MTQDTNKEDEQWLNALAGRTASDAAPKVIQQAESLRRVLKTRNEHLVPKADDMLYQKLQFRLRREGLDSSRQGWRNPKLWGIAATILLCIGIVFQMDRFNFNGEDKDILMGGGSETVMIVADPEARLAELKAGLGLTGEVPKVSWKINCEIQVTIKDTKRVQDYLNTQRIEPKVEDGNAIFALAPTSPHGTCFWNAMMKKFGE